MAKKTQDTTKRVVTYDRTTPYIDSLASVSERQRAISELAYKLGDVVERFIDNEPKRGEQSQLVEIMKMVDGNEFDILVVHSLAQLSMEPLTAAVEFLYNLTRTVDLHTVLVGKIDKIAIGELYIYTIDQRSERGMISQARAKERGVKTGRNRIGLDMFELARVAKLHGVSEAARVHRVSRGTVRNRLREAGILLNAKGL